jgi:hypothetical protein
MHKIQPTRRDPFVVDKLLDDLLEAFTQGEVVEVKDLAGILEVADFFGVGRSTISNWSARRKDNGIPHPVITLGCGTIWNLRKMVPWWRTWNPPNGKKVGKLPPGWEND